jgi:hypothetical protein
VISVRTLGAALIAMVPSVAAVISGEVPLSLAASTFAKATIGSLSSSLPISGLLPAQPTILK